MSTIVNTVNSPLIVWGEEIGNGEGERRKGGKGDKSLLPS